MKVSLPHVTIIVASVGILPWTTLAFTSVKPSLSDPSTRLLAAPERLQENVEGVVFVNEKCINCAACASFAPQNFARNFDIGKHVVYHQPASEQELIDSRAAMSACPVAAIRVETSLSTDAEKNLAKNMALSPKVNKRELPFPRILSKDTWYVGHHNEASFGAVPYLTKASYKEKDAWIMIDTPKFGKSSRDAVEKLTGASGPDYLVLTHVDDTADHGKWAEFYPNLKRVFHAGDTGNANWLGDLTLEEVEVLLPKSSGDASKTMYDLDGAPLSEDEAALEEFVIHYTPGHSPGSISMLHKGTGIIFTGDTLGYSTRTNSLTGFPQFGNDRSLQATTLEWMRSLPWQIIAPGHGHARDYTLLGDREKEINDAIEELKAHRR